MKNLTEAERAYRRGALQSIQFLKSIMHGMTLAEKMVTLAKWEQELIAGRDSLDSCYLGTYLQEIKRRVIGGEDRATFRA